MDVNSNERRRQTRSNVYHYLYGAQEFCTRQSLAQALDLSLPTIYQNLTDLVDAGLVRYAGQSQSTRRAQGQRSGHRPRRPGGGGHRADGGPAPLLRRRPAPERDRLPQGVAHLQL